MGKGVRKTVTEKQSQVYGGFQSEIRKMTKEDHDRYAPEGTPGWYRWQKRLAEQAERRTYREKAIREFEKTVPTYGSFKDFGPEEAAALAEERTRKMELWKKRRQAFMEELDKKYPAILF